ncbi:MAG: hypothetical protein FK733_07120 [Asgard group archaeon]|nr:hypothetical protein [Asgard group archaeon]
MTNKRTIKFILILTVFLGASVSAIGIMAMNSGAVTSFSEIPEAANPTVSIVSLDSDVTLSKSVEKLDSVLSPYIDVDTTTITDVELLDGYLDDNLNNYMILLGHSNEEGIEIDEQLITWSELSPIVTDNKDQIVIIPTCNSYNLYQSNPQAIQNVLSPFSDEVDYRISVDFTSLAMGLLLQNKELALQSALDIGSDYEYIILPDETLFAVTESGSQTISGDGRIELGDVMAEFLLANSFIIGASVSTALIQGVLRAFGHGSVPISFIIQLFSIASNFQHTYWFFITHLGLLFADYVVDRYSTLYWQSTFSEFGWGRFIYYSRIITRTYYTFYSAYYVVNGVTRQDYYHVKLTVDMHVLDTLVIYNSISLGILTTALTSWVCTGSGTRYISGGGGGGGDLPF